LRPRCFNLHSATGDYLNNASLYDADEDGEAVSQEVRPFRAAIAASHGIVIATPDNGAGNQPPDNTQLVDSRRGRRTRGTVTD